MKVDLDKVEQFGKFFLFSELCDEGARSTLAWHSHS